MFTYVQILSEPTPTVKEMERIQMVLVPPAAGEPWYYIGQDAKKAIVYWAALPL
jgi:hypothetical protein